MGRPGSREPMLSNCMYEAEVRRQQGGKGEGGRER